MSRSNQRRHAHPDQQENEPELSRLIPARKRRHRVRVQGRLAVVRCVSTANPRPSTSAGGEHAAHPIPSPVGASSSSSPSWSDGAASPATTTPRFESGVAGSAARPARAQARRRRRRSSDDDDGGCDDDDTSTYTHEDEAKETAVRDGQLRGYGIGGAGNITGRPTEVYGSAKSSSSSLPRFPPFYSSSPSNSSEKKGWSLRELFGRTTGERKGKGVATA